MAEWVSSTHRETTHRCLAEVQIFLNQQEVAIVAHWTSFSSVLALLRFVCPYHQAGDWM
jgi:hypothetical protein